MARFKVESSVGAKKREKGWMRQNGAWNNILLKYTFGSWNVTRIKIFKILKKWTEIITQKSKNRDITKKNDQKKNFGKSGLGKKWKYNILDCKLEIGIWTENENEKFDRDEDENMNPKWTLLFIFIRNFQCKGMCHTVCHFYLLVLRRYLVRIPKAGFRIDDSYVVSYWPTASQTRFD